MNTVKSLSPGLPNIRERATAAAVLPQAMRTNAAVKARCLQCKKACAKKVQAQREAIRQLAERDVRYAADVEGTYPPYSASASPWQGRLLSGLGEMDNRTTKLIAAGAVLALLYFCTRKKR